MSKLKSRKLWLSVAAFLGSLGTAIAGLCTDNEVIVMAGVICAAASSAIYTICEALVDACREEE